MNLEKSLIAQLARLEIAVDAATASRLWSFLEELLRWNKRVNLTSVTEPGEALEKHLVDSLTLLPLLEGSERLLDVGSGGGFPGIPLKIARPGLQVLSVDAVQKKIAFQRHAARCLGLAGFRAEHLRVEDLPRQPLGAGGFDLVVSRAFASLPVFAALALPCLAPQGRIIAMKGAEAGRELAEARPHLLQLGLDEGELLPLRLPVSGAERGLIILRRA